MVPVTSDVIHFTSDVSTCFQPINTCNFDVFHFTSDVSTCFQPINTRNFDVFINSMYNLTSQIINNSRRKLKINQYLICI